MASSLRPPKKRVFRHTNKQTSSASPNSPSFLPATIQTSLLNVGMRIRKAVPEGYKTFPTKTLSSHNNSSSPPPKSSSYREYHSPIGLVPYCGILKTGNLDLDLLEENGNEVPPLDFSGLGGDNSEFFPSSQESMISEVASIGGGARRFDALPLLVNSHKRLYEDDDGPRSPVLHPDPLRSNPISSGAPPAVVQDMALRPMLQPKTRKAVPVAGERMVLKEQEEVEVEVMDVDVDDFGEAGFLRFEDMLGDEGF